MKVSRWPSGSMQFSAIRAVGHAPARWVEESYGVVVEELAALV